MKVFIIISGHTEVPLCDFAKTIYFAMCSCCVPTSIA